ncbi:Ribosomal protein PSRP-3/Ycf65 [Dillenia turbinata]|uniref:Ribosomal protein PSRP-3/Ycf65 n=1 Tax=Dillenia turbinata TaxID=194707 RepID=A0AAN8VPI0_9MAGN
MLSLAQSGVCGALTYSSFSSHNFKQSKLSIHAKPKALSLNFRTFLGQTGRTKTDTRLSAPSATESETVIEETTSSTQNSGSEEIPKEKENVEVAAPVKQVLKPRLVLKFIWMEKNIGLGLDQMIPGHGTVPLSPYFFWPRKDAWEELKSTVETKPWISQKKMIILLNQATDIINLWQQSGGNLS